MKIDHSINDRHKLSGTYAHDLNQRSLSSNSAGIQTLFNRAVRDGGPLAFYNSDRSFAPLGRAAWDWTLSPKLLNHMNVSFQRQGTDTHGASSDINGAQQLGIKGLITNGYPYINWGGGPFVTLDNVGNTSRSFTASSSFGFLDTMSWFRGRHFFKFGVDLRTNRRNNRPTQGGVINFNARATAIPNEAISGTQIGYAFASYLLGIVDSASLLDPVALGARRHYTRASSRTTSG